MIEFGPGLPAIAQFEPALCRVQMVIIGRFERFDHVSRAGLAEDRSRSIAAAGIAAHEAGHALQHAKAYGPLALRTALVPAAQIGSNLSWLLMLAGMLLQWGSLMWVGIAFFSAAVLFSLVTLPVEFDASRRAKEVLPTLGLVSSSDREGVSAVLNSAAMTYVAAAATAVLQLLYFILRANSSRD